MAHSDYLFVHPLLGADEAWSGYRIRSPRGQENSELLARLCATGKLKPFDQRHPWLLPVCDTASGGEQCADPAILVYSAQPAAEGASKLEAELRKARRKLCLQTSPQLKLPATGTWDYVLIAASHARSLPPFTLIGLSSRTTVIATEVHSHADRQWLLDNACALSSDEFLLARATPNAKADTTRVKLLELLGLIAKDADTPALEDIFRQEAKLSYSLLRLVNSAAIAPPNPITSFAQAINLLGRRQLQRWLQLLVYADPNNGQHPNPLLQKAACRGRLLEMLAQQVEPPLSLENVEDTAFMIGTFSLLDVLLNMSMAEILQQLPLTETVTGALAEHVGSLGQLLDAIACADAGDLESAARQLKALGISGEKHLQCQLDALAWAASIRQIA